MSFSDSTRVSFQPLKERPDSASHIVDSFAFKLKQLMRSLNAYDVQLRQRPMLPGYFLEREQQSRFVLLDIESNGSAQSDLYREIMEIACCELNGEVRSRALKPIRCSPASSGKLNRMQAEGAFGSDESWPVHLQAMFDLLRALTSRETVLVSHNVEFDLFHLFFTLAAMESAQGPEFVNAYRKKWEDAYERNEIPLLHPGTNRRIRRSAVVDTLDLAHLIAGNSDSFKLKDLAALLTGEEQQQSHRAADDVELLRRVVRLLCQRAEAENFRVALSFLPDTFALKWLLSENRVPLFNREEAWKRLKELFKGTEDGQLLPTVQTREETNAVTDRTAEDCIGLIDWSRKVQPAKGVAGRAGKQYEIIDFIHQGIQKGGISLLEAGTGTGKTLGYLLPVLQFLIDHPEERFVISTHTKALQMQIVHALESLQGEIDMDFVVVKGKVNYVCIQRLMSRLSESQSTQNSREEMVMLVYLLNRLLDGWDGDLETVSDHVSNRYDPAKTIPPQVNFSEEESECKSCKLRSRCHIIKIWNDINSPGVRIIVTNDSLLLTEASADIVDDVVSFPKALREIKNAVLDEGHHADSTYRQINSVTFDAARSAVLRKDFQNRMLRPLQAFIKALTEDNKEGGALARPPSDLRYNVGRLNSYFTQMLSSIEKAAIRYAYSQALRDGMAYPGERRVAADVATFTFLERLQADTSLMDPALAPDLVEIRRIYEEVLLHERTDPLSLLNCVKDLKTIVTSARESDLAEKRKKKGGTVGRLAELITACKDTLSPLPESSRLIESLERPIDEYSSGAGVAASLKAVLKRSHVVAILSRDLLQRIRTSAMTIIANSDGGDGANISVGRWESVLAGIDESMLFPSHEISVRALADSAEPDFDGALDSGNPRLEKTQELQVKNRSVEWEIRLFQVDPAEEIQRFLKRYKRLIALSATLPEEFTVRNFGLRERNDYRYCAIASPFDIAEQLRVVVPEYVPVPAGSYAEEHIFQSFIDTTRWLQILQHGLLPGSNDIQPRLLNLYTSRRALRLHQALFEQLETNGLFNDTTSRYLHFQGSLNKEEILSRFCEDRGARALFGMNSYGEGFDIVDRFYQEHGAKKINPIRVLIINKLPVPNVHSPEIGALFNRFLLRDEARSYDRIRRSRSGGPDRFIAKAEPLPREATDYLVHLARIVFRQWTGRLIRTEQDQGILVVQDKRIFFSSEGIDFLDHLNEAGSWPMPNLRTYGRSFQRDRDAAIRDRRSKATEAIEAAQQYQNPDRSIDRRAEEERATQEAIDACRQLLDAPFVGASPFLEILDVIEDVLRLNREQLPPVISEGWRIEDRLALVDERVDRVRYKMPLNLMTKPPLVLADVINLAARQERREVLPYLRDIAQTIFQQWHSSILPEDFLSALRKIDLADRLAWRLAKDQAGGPRETLLKTFELYCEYQRGQRHNPGIVSDAGPIPWDEGHLLSIIDSVNTGERVHFGINEDGVVPITQRSIIQELRRRKSSAPALYRLPTGFGKTLCFQMPALLDEGLTVVFAPLRALIEDQETEFHRSYPEVSSAVVSSASGGEAGFQELLIRLYRSDPSLRMLYIHPSELDHKLPLWYALLAYENIVRFVFDEVHSVYSWGDSFMFSNHLARILAERYNEKRVSEGRNRAQIVGFSATLTEEGVDRLRELGAFRGATLTGGFVDRPEIYYQRLRGSGTKHDQKVAAIVGYLKDHPPAKDQRCIVFCSAIGAKSRAGVEQVYTGILKEGFPAEGLARFHAEAGLSVRDLDHANIIVSTAGLGMGVNLKHIRTVILYDFPSSIEDLLQFMGRMRNDGGMHRLTLVILDPEPVGVESESDWSRITKADQSDDNFQGRYNYRLTPFAKREGNARFFQFTTIGERRNTVFAFLDAHTARYFARSATGSIENSRYKQWITSLHDKRVLKLVSCFPSKDSYMKSHRIRERLHLVAGLYPSLRCLAASAGNLLPVVKGANSSGAENEFLDFFVNGLEQRGDSLGDLCFHDDEVSGSVFQIMDKHQVAPAWAGWYIHATVWYLLSAGLVRLHHSYSYPIVQTEASPPGETRSNSSGYRLKKIEAAFDEKGLYRLPEPAMNLRSGMGEAYRRTQCYRLAALHQISEEEADILKNLRLLRGGKVPDCCSTCSEEA